MFDNPVYFEPTFFNRASHIAVQLSCRLERKACDMLRIPTWRSLGLKMQDRHFGIL